VPRSPPAACRICAGASGEAQIVYYLGGGFVTDGKTPATFTAHVRSGFADGGAVPVRVSIYSPPIANDKAFGSAGAGYTVLSAVGVLVPETALYVTAGSAAGDCVVDDDAILSQ
jgi:hypothetical protein